VKSPIKKYTVLALCCLIISSIVQAAPKAKDATKMIREEIEIIERRIGQTEAGKQGIIRQLQDIDRKIDLRRRLVRELERQSENSSQRLRHVKKRIGQLESQITKFSLNLIIEEAELAELRIRVGERITEMYKHSAHDRMALLLGAADLNDLSQRQHYLKAVARFDRLKLDRLSEKRDQVRDGRQKLVDVRQLLTLEQARRLSELERAHRLINTKRSEEKELRGEKQQRQKLFERIAGDQDLLHALLEERKRSLEQIEWEIHRIEGRRPSTRVVWQPDVPFKNLIGKLPWPLERKRVVQKFGRIRHPKLGTTTINPGVDLEASPGDPVYSVARGHVTKITWLRGFGNTVILSHGDGYYTVYARLSRIFVSEGEVTKPGQPIGEIGESGAGSNFHFEVWSKRNKQDPLKWLQ